MAKRFLGKAQENADEYSNEVEQLRAAVGRSDEEKQRLEAELVQVKEMLQREVGRADTEGKRNAVIIAEYKQICQRLEDDYNTAKTSLSDIRTKISKCDKCSSHVKESSGGNGNAGSPNSATSHPLENRVDPILSRAQERVRELELELAQTKLAHVEAECRNQDLTHQLHATASELQAARNSWPWLSKTLSSIKEAANKREMMSGGGGGSGGGTGANILRRDSAPASSAATSSSGAGDVRHHPHHHHHSLHSQSRDSFKEAV